MKRLEEIIGTYYADGKCPTYTTEQLEFTVEEVKEIAIAYAKFCLEKAAQEAQIKMEYTLSFGEPSVYFVQETEQNNYNLSVSKESITNIKLP